MLPKYSNYLYQRRETGKTVETDIKLTILLNQWSLLNKLDMDKLFSSELLRIRFDQLIETIAHELLMLTNKQLTILPEEK